MTTDYTPTETEMRVLCMCSLALVAENELAGILRNSHGGDAEEWAHRLDVLDNLIERSGFSPEDIADLCQRVIGDDDPNIIWVDDDESALNGAVRP